MKVLREGGGVGLERRFRLDPGLQTGPLQNHWNFIGLEQILLFAPSMNSNEKSIFCNGSQNEMIENYWKTIGFSKVLKNGDWSCVRGSNEIGLGRRRFWTTVWGFHWSQSHHCGSETEELQHQWALNVTALVFIGVTSKVLQLDWF